MGLSAAHPGTLWEMGPCLVRLGHSQWSGPAIQGRGQGPGRATPRVEGPGGVRMLRDVPLYRGDAGQRDQPQGALPGRLFVQGSCSGFPSRHQPRGAALASPRLRLQLNPCPDASWIRNDLSWSQACPEAQPKPFGGPGRGSSAKDTQNWPKSESSSSSPDWLKVPGRDSAAAPALEEPSQHLPGCWWRGAGPC